MSEETPDEKAGRRLQQGFQWGNEKSGAHDYILQYYSIYNTVYMIMLVLYDSIILFNIWCYAMYTRLFTLVHIDMST